MILHHKSHRTLIAAVAIVLACLGVSFWMDAHTVQQVEPVEYRKNLEFCVDAIRSFKIRTGSFPSDLQALADHELSEQMVRTLTRDMRVDYFTGTDDQTGEMFFWIAGKPKSDLPGFGIGFDSRSGGWRYGD